MPKITINIPQVSAARLNAIGQGCGWAAFAAFVGAIVAAFYDRDGNLDEVSGIATYIFLALCIGLMSAAAWMRRSEKNKPADRSKEAGP